MPEFASALHIESAHDAELDVGAAVVADRRTHHRDVADDRRRRCHLITPELAFNQSNAFGQHDFAVRAEVRATLAGLRIDCEQARVDRREDDALGAGGIRARGGRAPGRIAPEADPARRHLRIIARAIDAGIEHPALRAARRIEREDFPGCGAEEERAVDQQRRRLERQRVVRTNETLAELAGPESPRDLQTIDILRRDLRQRRVTLTTPVAAVRAPFERSGVNRRRRQQHREQQGDAHDRLLAEERFKPHKRPRTSAI